MATFADFGLLGDVFGGGTSSLNEYLSPEQQQAMQRQALLSTAAALLQAGGPSDRPISLGQALGAGLQAGTTSYGKAQEGAIAQLLTRQKLDEYKKSQEMQKNIARILTGGAAPTPGQPITPDQALAIPGMAAGPTVDRAAMIGQAVSPEISRQTQNQLKADQYRQIADAMTAAGRFEDAARAQTMAEKLSPSTQEVVGEPFRAADGQYYQRTKTGEFIKAPMQLAAKPVGQPQQVLGSNNKPTLVQMYDDGTFQVVSGVTPLIAPEKIDTGAGIQFVNPYEMQPGAVIKKDMTPAERANLNLRQQEFARGGFQIKETPDGFTYVPTAPGGATFPIVGPGNQQLKGVGGKITESESNAAGFAQRMELANSIINNLPGNVQPGVLSRSLEAVPLIGGSMARAAQGVDTQKYDQAAQDWIRAKLRKESGAAIGKDEMIQEYATYFPQVGDSQAKIDQKAEARRVVTLGMQKSAGKAYEPYTPLPSEEPAKPKQLIWNGKKFVYQ